ncbi:MULTISPECIES: GNAT family N-acetyltransferase [unclassified Sedimentibacter]|uniref:GNAT family N-acetyltransferase n=1 Tax=unclassified Sedimentibacter TaxID=2649220 RepID=UPI0027E028AE|nr:GNAT family N-acetyltransferase [Sedimentibacter sp. MB35-C1]WMJ76892.1 GNAT family N-acetyltransferase [Sedimentibacter sp. MB35-C1]
MNINIKFETKGIDWNTVSSLLGAAGLSGTDSEICKRAFLGSQAAVFVFDNDKLIGVSRAISDCVKQAAIYDVAVLPEYQGKGIGRILIENITNKFPGCNFILYSNPGKEDFYRKFGFRIMKTGMAKFVKADRMEERGFTE